jgi:Uncharacterized conserved protein
METKDYLNFIVNEIHTVVVATVDDEGLPVTAAIDMMYADDGSVYFLTAKGKNLYDRLKNRKYLALTGMKGQDTMSRVALSLRGTVREIGEEKLEILLDKNPYMYEIYPTEESRKALSVFQIYEGVGEWFDLSKRPIERNSFSFGNHGLEDKGYFISDICIGCGKCIEVCPQDCISSMGIPYVIEQNNCLHCGNCEEICPYDAVERR